MQISSSSHIQSSLTSAYTATRLASVKPSSSENNANTQTKSELSTEEEQQLREMKARDREVRAHEQAHKSAAGGLASGGATYDYATGPDGKQYAVSGEVKIDTSPVKGDPEATARKAEKIQQAATAPADPSAQDLQVAAQAFAMEQEANSQIRKERLEEAAEKSSSDDKSSENKVEGSDSELGLNSQGKSESNISSDEGIQCAVCGGQHSGESHTQSNIEKLNKVFDLAEVSEGRASIFSVIT